MQEEGLAGGFETSISQSTVVSIIFDEVQSPSRQDLDRLAVRFWEARGNNSRVDVTLPPGGTFRAGERLMPPSAIAAQTWPWQRSRWCTNIFMDDV